MTHFSLSRASIDALKSSLDRGRQELRRLSANAAPTRGYELALAATGLVDDIVARLSAAAGAAAEKQDGCEGRTLAESVAIVALGGYGRREMCPRSDIDLLFLVPTDDTPAASSVIEAYVNAILYGLWDLGFEVGHSVRSVEECVSIALSDQSVKTGLLDARLLPDADGMIRKEHEVVYKNLVAVLERDVFSGSGSTRLIEEKLEEATRRRERFGNSVFLLEPNVKAGEGGLRDLHTARWIARARWRAQGFRDLLHLGVLSPREGKVLERAYGFILRVRAELHLQSGRRQDILGFELQEPVAYALGYLKSGETDRDRRMHGVERLMRAYYFHARQNRHLSELIIERATSHPRDRPERVQHAPGGFKLFSGTLTVSDRDQFLKDPGALVRIFRVAQDEALPIYSYTKDLIAESLRLLDRDVRRRPEVVSDFLSLIEDPKADGSMLDVMHDLGVLRRMIPEFYRVTARWKHSLYHVYTVDVHSVFVVKHLKLLRTGAYAEEQSEMTRLLAGLARPSVLYLAAFLHDVGKGWTKGDHSKRGEVAATLVGQRFEAANIPSWTAEDTRDLAWLVREHLTMSDISQRRDVADRNLLGAFAEGCRTVERLTMLYLLTFADMKGTSPKVWSDWKGSLLREVYDRALGVLSESSGAVRENDASHVEARRCRAEAEMLDLLAARGSSVSPQAVGAFTRAMPERYMLSIPPKQMLRHSEMWRDVSERGGLALRVRQLRREGTSRLTIVCRDRPGLLALLAGTLAANRMQILSAQIFSIELTAIDVLYLKDEGGDLCDDPERWEHVRTDLLAVLFGGKDIEALLDQRVRGSQLKGRSKPHVKTEIVVANDVCRTETVIDVFCQDRLGALYTIAKALADSGLSISIAKISTQGDRVADGFYVTDSRTGLKIDDRARVESVRECIRAAIDPDAS